ncbi:unnamed protein product [Durusdinium trenchii]|uniref:NAD-dependent protein deacetylase sirtuin-2 (Regulatory protein SIR2 homolog 2) (SIR2-like protein 2) n=2 Tax=Durusdinium trenchii TaxID=1381693 RepID=A0ABP0HCC2_9DINO
MCMLWFWNPSNPQQPRSWPSDHALRGREVTSKPAMVDPEGRSRATERLRSRDLDGIAQFMADHARHVVVLCGAGISTSAGIPDFRSPGTGLYHNLQRFDLPEAEAIFDLKYFQKHPDAFYELCREMWPGNYAPTACHYFIRLLSDKGILQRCYTQNIDSLEHAAGIPAELLVAAHGNFDAAHVVDDNVGLASSYDVDITELQDALHDPGDEGWQELREHHGGLVKPKIVFFGEELPKRFFELHKADLALCDLLLVMGTSLQVSPFNTLLSLTSDKPRLLINREAVGSCDELAGGFCFQADSDGQDVFYQGDCDAGVEALAERLGWLKELQELVALGQKEAEELQHSEKLPSHSVFSEECH